LQNISTILNVPVSFFFEDAPGDPATAQPGMAEANSSNYVVDFLSSSEGLQLNRAFIKIPDPKVRRKLGRSCQVAGRPSPNRLTRLIWPWERRLRADRKRRVRRAWREQAIGGALNHIKIYLCHCDLVSCACWH
jgi:hypothetical protein